MPWSEGCPRSGGASSTSPAVQMTKREVSPSSAMTVLLNACPSKYLVLRGTLLLLEEEES